MKKYALESSEPGTPAYLAKLTPIFKTDSAQEWGDAASAKCFKSATAARTFAEKWKLNAKVVRLA